jgi:CspA family cold shock protein
MKKREYGYVSAFDPFKGYGFIRRKQGKDLFFSYEDVICLETSCGVGDNVTFEIKDAPKGQRAFNIKRII